MRDHVWLVLGLLGLTVLMVFVSSGLSRAVAANGEAAITARLEATRAANPGWPWDIIDAGTLEVGMTEEMVFAALGTPDSAAETTDASGRHTE